MKQVLSIDSWIVVDPKPNYHSFRISFNIKLILTIKKSSVFYSFYSLSITLKIGQSFDRHCREFSLYMI